MANLPAPTAPDKPLDLKEDQFRTALVELVANGRTVGEIAKALEPDDEKARKQMRARLRRLLQSDQEFQGRIARRAQQELALGLIPASAALRRRAARGNPTAIRLLFESSGFHNPRVKHEHSGDIKISLEIPRPPRVEDEGEVVDAEVVED